MHRIPIELETTTSEGCFGGKNWRKPRFVKGKIPHSGVSEGVSEELNRGRVRELNCGVRS